MDYSVLDYEIRKINLPYLDSIGFKVIKELKGFIELETQYTFIKLNFDYRLPGLEISLGLKENPEEELSFNDIQQLLEISVFTSSIEEFLIQINSVINEHKALLVDSQEFYRKSFEWKNRKNDDYNFNMQMSFAVQKADDYWDKEEYSLFIKELIPFKTALSDSYLRKLNIASKKK